MTQLPTDFRVFRVVVYVITSMIIGALAPNWIICILGVVLFAAGDYFAAKEFGFR